MPVLYHYTDKPGRNAIYQTNTLKATHGAAGLAVYFTELPPTTPKEELLRNNYGSTDEQWQERTRYWFKFNSEDYPNVKKMDWGSRNVWIHPGGDIKLHEKSMIVLYHYTDKAGLEGIYSTGYIKALQPHIAADAKGAEATLPKGVYFTEMKPTAGKSAILWNAFGARDMKSVELVEKTRFWFKFSVHGVPGVYKRPTYKNRNEWVCPTDVKINKNRAT